MSYQNKPLCLQRINSAIEKAWQDNTVLASVEASKTAYVLEVVHELINNPENKSVTAAFKEKELERYSILPGRIFGIDFKAKEKFKILRLVANDVIYKNLSTGEVHTEEINALLRKWNTKKIKEISLVTEVLRVVKQALGPLLGVFLTSVLLNWLIKKL